MTVMIPRIDNGVVDGFTGRWDFLSNFHPSPLVYDGIAYPTVEHAFQATKTLDREVRGRIARMPTPYQAKRAGWSLPPHAPLRADWDDVRVRVMRDLIKLKFEPFGELAWSLVETYPAGLVEANNWHDNFWGDCRCTAKPRCRAQGQNMLGRDLVVWRDHLIHRGKRKP